MERQTDTDHDLLITLHEQVKQVRLDIKDIKDNLADRLTKVEMGKLSAVDFIQFRNSEFTPLKKSVDNLKWWLALFIGGGGTIITLVNWFLLYRQGK